MHSVLERRLIQLQSFAQPTILSGGFVGLERESLRVGRDGQVSQLRHPRGLGASLTHPFITTDYSEALLELITPPMSRVEDSIGFLSNLEKFVYQQLEDDEFLWASSMPCTLNNGKKIPLAQYGSSNAGQMKTIYRRGLGNRYGRVMQIISGIHFNYSLPRDFWPVFQQIEGDAGDSGSFVSDAYFGMIRNLQRYGWIIPYLFGASPAVCRSFVADRPTSLNYFDFRTLYEPHGTSLRMGDIGYTNSKEDGVGIKANYDNLDTYVSSLQHAINTPSDAWKGIGVKNNGRYEQLNDHILQIENEYYSTVRPKQIPLPMEKPSTALKQRGVTYVELRSLDVNPFEPLGISEEQGLFVEMFMIYCQLMDSPVISRCERRDIDQNFESVAHKGRDAKLHLKYQGNNIYLKQWGMDICDNMQMIAEQLDNEKQGGRYQKALLIQKRAIEEPELTLSAQILNSMRDNKQSFFEFAYEKSQEHQAYFKQQTLSVEVLAQCKRDVMASNEKIKEMESQDEVEFEVFLAAYMAKK